jgi:hypothetical protein
MKQFPAMAIKATPKSLQSLSVIKKVFEGLAKGEVPSRVVLDYSDL